MRHEPSRDPGAETSGGLRGRRPRLVGEKDRLIPAEQCKALLLFLDRAVKRDRPRWEVARLAVLLGMQAGLRAGEMVALRVGDCDLEEGEPRLLVRGGKYRAADHVDPQPIPEDLARELRAATGGAPARWFVLRKLDGAGYTTQRIRQLVRGAYDQVRIRRVYTLHSLRHRYGTDIYRATRDHLLTQRLVRHKRSATTDLYVHLSESEVEIAEAMRAIARPNHVHV